MGVLTAFTNFFDGKEVLLVFTMLGFLVIFAIIISGLYQNVSTERENVLFTQFNTILIAIIFVYIVLKFMGEKMTVLGKEFDIGLLLYISVVIFIIFVLGG